MRKLSKTLSITASIGLLGAMILASGTEASYRELLSAAALATMSLVIFLAAQDIYKLSNNNKDGNSEKRDQESSHQEG